MNTNSADCQDGRISAASSHAAIDVARELLRRMFDRHVEAPAVMLSDGTRLFTPRAAASATIVARNLGALRSLALGSSSAAAERAVIGGDLDVRGDVESAIAQLERVAARLSGRDKAAIVGLALRLPWTPGATRKPGGRRAYQPAGRKHSLGRDRAAIAYHYDVSNEFYALWLDRELVYSCAYFRGASDSLDRAQLDKLDHICRKLRLRAGERMLDVGCGWGSLVRFAAREYGAHAVGVTLSTRQAEYAQRRIDEEGLTDRCRVELRDYRELAPLGVFDKAASIGMVEHVGSPLLSIYFRAVYDALAPGGLFLNHGIASQRTQGAGIGRLVGRVFPKRSRFIERYVFPDGDLPYLGEIVAAAEAAGFEVRDVENLREHYPRTLRHWVKRLEANASAARAAVGDETYNVWRFYMAGSAHEFSVGRIGLYQTLLVKRHADGTADVPATREDLYTPRGQVQE